MPDRLVARVHSFGAADAVRLRRERLRAPSRGRVRVRVTHASLGSTDRLARRGGYLLQPRPGFVPGYDFVGVLQTADRRATALGLHEGMRVAACLPRMGAHATHVDVAPSLLVPLPDALGSEVAAALPLDLVTARRAFDLLAPRPGASVLVQGVTGPVGGLVAQIAANAGHRVCGTASDRTRQLAEARGVRVLDYRAADWPEQLLELAPGGVDGSVDHTGSPLLRRVTAPGGRIVRISFTGRPGRERRDTLTGGTAAVARVRARPAERLCSIPLYLVTQRSAYRRLLADQLALVADGRLTPPPVRVLPFGEIAAAHRAAEQPAPGEKTVLLL